MSLKLPLTAWVATLASAGVVCAEERGFYSAVDVDVAITSDADVKQTPAPGPGEKVDALSFSTGARLSLAGGYRVREWISLGAETGIIMNSLSGYDGDAFVVPLLANVELSLPNRSRFVPFVGGGPGAAVGILRVDDQLVGKGLDTELTFAWQVFTGFRWKVTENLSAGVVYKFFEMGSTSQQVRHGETLDDQIRIGRRHTHSFGAVVAFEF